MKIWIYSILYVSGSNESVNESFLIVNLFFQALDLSGSNPILNSNSIQIIIDFKSLNIYKSWTIT